MTTTSSVHATSLWDGEIVEESDLGGIGGRAVHRNRSSARGGDLPAEIAHEVVHRDDLVVLA